MRFPIRAALAPAMFLPALASPAHAQPAQAAPAPALEPVRSFENHALVRLAPTSPRHALAVASLDLLVMSERVGPLGQGDYIASPADLALLAEAGVPLEVRNPNIQATLNAERARLDAQAEAGLGGPINPLALAAVADESFFTDFKPLPQIQSFVAALRADLPEVVSPVRSIGTTHEGRPLEVFTIAAPGAPSGRPAVFINGGAHAREWINPMTVLYISRALAEGYGVDPRITALLDRASVEVLPVANPDGYAYSWLNTGTRLWRKNRRNNGNGTFGVDWNRNFSTGWGVGASTTTSSDIYQGTAPFSEPETRAFRDFVLASPHLFAHIDFHSYSALVLWPWGDRTARPPAADEPTFVNLGFAMGRAMIDAGGTYYDPIQSVALYPAGGVSQDWAYDVADLWSYTIELRPDNDLLGGFAPSPTQILPTARENLAAFLTMAEGLLDGITTRFLPDGKPLSLAQGAAAEVAVQVTSTDAAVTAATLHTRAGTSGPFTPTPMALSNGAYRASLPAADCGGTIEYYTSFTTGRGNTVLFPARGNEHPVTAAAGTFTTVFEDTMETNTGWTVGAPTDTATTAGRWQRADPQATAAQPENDASPAGTLCWITGPLAGTGTGANDVDGGATTLTSPRLNASAPAGTEAWISYARWFSNNAGSEPSADVMFVELSPDDGTTWQPLESAYDNAGVWLTRRFRIADVVAPTDRLRVRFIAFDGRGGSIVEAGVDDLRIEHFAPCRGPLDLAPPFGVLNSADVLAALALVAAADPAADFDASGEVTFLDQIEYLRRLDAAP